MVAPHLFAEKIIWGPSTSGQLLSISNTLFFQDSQQMQGADKGVEKSKQMNSKGEEALLFNLPHSAREKEKTKTKVCQLCSRLPRYYSDKCWWQTDEYQLLML